MHLEVNFELTLNNQNIKQKILEIFQEIAQGYLVESNYILEDLNLLIQQLSNPDKEEVIKALNTYFRDYEFVRQGGYLLQGNFSKMKVIDYQQVYDQDRKTYNYESILDKIKMPEYRRQNKIPDELVTNLPQLIKLKIKSLLVFDLLDYHLDKNDLSQIEILKILLELFYCNSIFTEDESKTLEQLIGSLLQKQLYEISYYFENLKKDDPINYHTFVEYLQNLQLTVISKEDSNLQAFLQKNQRYEVLLMNFSKDVINIRSTLEQFISSLIQIPTKQCQFSQVISYVNNIENVNDNINDLYVQTVFYYWKKYCFKYNLQADLKNQLESLPKIGTDRKQILIDRYFKKQKDNIQDTIYLFVIQRICYFVKEIDDEISLKISKEFTKIMDNNFKAYQEKKQILTQIVLKDYLKFQEYSRIIRSLRFYKSDIIQQNDQIVQLITNLVWIYNQNENLFNTLHIITQDKKSSFLEAVCAIEKEIKQLITVSKNNLDFLLFQNLLRIIYAEYPNEENNYLLLKKLLESYGSLLRASMVLEANKFISNKLDQKSIFFFSKLGIRFIVIHKIFPNQTLSKLAQELLNYLTSNNQVKIYECLLSLKSIFRIKQIALSEDLQSISILIRNFSTNILGYLIMVNKSQNISLTAVKWTIYAIFNLFQKIDQSQFQKVEKCIWQLFINQCYDFPFIFRCLKNKVHFSKINKFVQLQYYLCKNLENKLLQLTEELFQQDEQLYEEWFRIKKPSYVMLSIEYLRIKTSQQYYPKQMNIPLEDFNISLSEYSEQKQKQILENWIEDMTDAQKFKLTLPLLFNIIKRGESPKDVLILANKILQQNRQLADRIGCFNIKSVFQIFFNNANDELRLIIMKFFSKEFPIPFLYQNPILDKLKFKTELLLLNSNLFYFFDQGYTIINMSLSENQKKIGKTELINDIFYEREKFETSDTCQMNSNTIDIMFDFEFNNSRNFIVADVHGKIIFETLIKILPFFKFWIVQIDSSRELQENLDQLIKILQQIDQQLKYNFKICIIVRNTEEKDQINKPPSTLKIEGQDIQIIYIRNQAANQINKQFKISQTQDVSNFLFDQIVDHQKKIESSNQKSQKEQFLLILQQFDSQYANNIHQINDHNSLKNKIQEKLNKTVNLEDGFYSQDAFPIRCILWKIKKLRQQNYELSIKPQENKQQIEKNKQQMEDLEKNINKQNATELLKLFCEIFRQSNYYIVYLWIGDKIRQFNEKNLIQLQKNDDQLNEQFNKLKQEKQKIKQKYPNSLEKQCQDNKEIKSKMSQLKQEMDNNRQNISRKTVGLQLFWRELIGLRKSKNYYLEIDPVLILYQLMRKGESLEFLDGDTLSIDTQFLLDLESKITQNKKQKILVISILGPQSSGKSTILNKIFGCHFWASVGRCTKGIDLQILQVQNEEQFQNHFDQILILDTEGLQNPNQNDPEFDKKIALFVLSISDIIIINVKGEINQQFKSLVEMCIFTLGHLKNGLSVFLSWFFNQNDNYKNVEPFRQQIKDVAQDLNIQWNENYQEQQVEHIDYAEILDIKDNIYGLGFASDQKGWQKKDWIQSVNNHTFSEEAYRQGINMIQQFIQKLQNQKDSLNNFSHFLQNVQRNWESIEKLPDLLEFSEIMQHQQNLVMKKHFDELWNNQDIRQVGVNLIQEAKLQLQSQQQIAFQNIRQIKQEQENKIEQTNQQIKTHLEEKMETFRSENKIQKKIMQKYLEKLKKLIEALEADCKLKLLNLIQEYEREYQQKKGYVQIDNFIQEVLNDQLKRKKFQGNDKEIESEFKKKWDEFISETERQSESQYLEMIKAQYKALQCISNQFILRTKNEQQYINYFRNEIIKQNPNNEQSKEQEQIFQLFKQEFSEAEQFIFINKKQNNLAYLDIFQQKIEEKLEKSKAQFLDMTQFYSQKSIYQVVAKQEIQNYLQNQFQNDFQNYFKKYEKQRNIKNYYYNFLSLLYYLQIKYDEELKQELDNIINNPTSWQQLKLLISSKSSQVSEAFSKLKKSLKFYDNDTLELDFSGKQFGQTFQDAYQSLKVIKIVDSPLNGVGSALDNSQKFRQQQFQKYIIIDTEIEIKPNQNQFQEDFNYIKSPKNDVPYNFRTTFPKQFNEIMIQQNGWRKLYNELYELIKQEIGYSKSTINKQAYQNNIEDENISSFNPYLITSIIQKVENNIKIKYNNQFAQYGVILTDVGERCIFYYCILIIWRFLCYQRWNLKNIQQKHQHNYYTELIRCKAEINQDNQKQSCIKATELVSKIQTLLKNQFLDRTKKEVVQQMNQVSMSNVELIAKLDKELLIGLNAKMFEDEQFKKKILSYTTDHKSFINLYILNILKQVQDQSLTEYSNKYRKELSLYLKSIKKNAKIFFEYIKNQQKEVKTIKYFVEDAKQKDKISYENYLFRLFIQCLLGKIEDKIDIIEDQYKEIFQLSNYHPVDNQFKINWQLFDPQDQQVYNLKSFVETLIQQIDLILDSIDQIRFKQTEYQLDIEFEKLKLQMNGCEYTCPCCNRKCDEDNDDVINHIHKCQNGHQIRGINGILISHNSPSLYTCEEILDECILRTLETNVQKTWKEVKKAHSNWNFKNINEAKNNENRVKWKNVWNIGLGKLICQHLKKSLNHEIIFSQKSDFQISISNIHYILILDDSGSMQGVNWDNAKNGALHCIKSLENVDCAKVSVIIFNGDARIVVECQKPNYIQMSSCISYKGGNTAFDPPFNLALQLIVKYKGFNKIQILFYTDGEAGYPQTTIDKFCQLPPQIRSLINLIACSGEKSSHSLQLMIQKFQQNMQQASLRNSVQPIEIQKVWTEVVSKNIHSQLV